VDRKAHNGFRDCLVDGSNPLTEPSRLVEGKP
jgi:hypothetical protein